MTESKKRSVGYVGAQIGEELKSRLDKIVRREGYNTSSLITLLIESWVNDKEKEDENEQR